MVSLFEQISRRLKSQYYFVNDEWLNDCIEFYTNQHENPQMEEVLQFVIAQWQLSDLREINNINGSFPPNLSQKKFIILPGKYIVQVEEMYDIATSKYKQLLKIRGTHISEVELSEAEKAEKWEPPKKRMIQLRLTDGIQNLTGIEYSYMSELNGTLLPGYKVMIVGPVKCRKGILLLESKNFVGIGGEVDKLLIPNALENVLARALGLEENPDPYNDEIQSNGRENINISDTEKQSIEMKQNKQVDSYSRIQTQGIQVEDGLFEEDFELVFEDCPQIESSHNQNCDFTSAPMEIEVTTAVEKPKSYKKDITFDDDDDCLLEMVDENQLTGDMGYENNALPYRDLPRQDSDDVVIINDKDDILEKDNLRSSSKMNDRQKNILAPYRVLPQENGDDLIIINDDDNILTSLGKDNSHSKMLPGKTKSSSGIFHSKLEEKQQSSLTSGKRNTPTSVPEKVIKKNNKPDRKITEFTKVTSSLKVCEAPHMKLPIISPSEEPNICEFIHTVKNLMVTETTVKIIRGRVVKYEKLTKKDSLWVLEALITDGTGTIEVSFSNQLLQNILGFSVQEFALKKKLIKTNADIEHELRTAFRIAESKIKSLDSLLELELNPTRKAFVIKVTDLTKEQKETIDKRLNNFLLKNKI